MNSIFGETSPQTYSQIRLFVHVRKEAFYFHSLYYELLYTIATYMSLFNLRIY